MDTRELQVITLKSGNPVYGFQADVHFYKNTSMTWVSNRDATEEEKQDYSKKMDEWAKGLDQVKRKDRRSG